MALFTPPSARYGVSVANVLAFENWLDSLDDLTRGSMERAIAHKYDGRRSPEAFDSADIKAAESRAYRRGHADGRAGKPVPTPPPETRDN